MVKLSAVHNLDGPEEILPTTRPTLSYYLVLVLVVIPLCAVTPVSWFYVIYSLYTGSIWTFASGQYIFFAIALAEVLFSVYHYNLAKLVSGPSPVQPPNVVDLQAAFRRVLQSGLASLPEDGPYDAETLDFDHPGSPAEFIANLSFDDSRAVDFRSYMRTWFKKVPWSAIRKHELRQWLYWSIFNTNMPSLEDMPATHRHTIDEAVELIEKRSGSEIPEGSNPAVTPMLLTLDDVRISFRPFLWYIFVAVTHLLAHKLLEHHWGAEFNVHGDVEYMIRIPENWDPENPKTRPIVFLHGLGLGLFHYGILITGLLQRFSDRPLLVPIQSHISQRIFHNTFSRPLSKRATVEGIAGAMRKHGFVSEGDGSYGAGVGDPITGVTMLSHSNGSFTHAWMLKAFPHLISRSCFVDPVTFCLWEGDVCYNFFYKACKTGFDMLMYYFVCSEVGVANFLHRHFDWSANSLWYEEIPHAKDPSKSMFVLGGKDFIVNSDRVVRYLKSHGIKKGLLYTPEHTHGQAFFNGSDVFNRIMDWLEESQ
ncbi:hypothetical protein BDM02DRAFT_3109605 [Thelephora ganbajun]|uniref:Uncharacterized protein n=1 Tax=Thelephora ganbajun TaxID=370292 RepID=A0ACB6ZRF7_THEGA|nr:hypothetical protein BDM02DRAFT_3109605 [Thelephora ganbajun]